MRLAVCALFFVRKNEMTALEFEPLRGIAFIAMTGGVVNEDFAAAFRQRIRLGNRGKQGLRVRMQRMGEDLFRFRHFYDFAAIALTVSVSYVLKSSENV